MPANSPSHTITTERLIAYPFCQEDYAELCQLHQDERVMETLGGVRSDAATQAFLDDKIAHYKKYGYGYWMFRDRQTAEFVGRGGIQHVEIEGKPEIEIGYTVRFSEWGKGYATEIADGLLHNAFDDLALENIVAFTLTTNVGSQRVMQKMGFAFDRQFEHKGDPHVLYRITKNAYANGV